MNTPGLIDSGYRGELKVLLVNTDPSEPFEVMRGERIAQLVIQRIEECRFALVDELPPSERGEGGFGSTGVQGEANAAKIRAVSPPAPPADVASLKAAHDALAARVAALEAKP